jgi:hypothetical protein
MAKLAKLHKPSQKGEPPKSGETVNLLQRTPAGVKDKIQLCMTPETRIAFQTYAAVHTKGNMSRLFEMLWDSYKQHHP